MEFVYYLLFLFLFKLLIKEIKKNSKIDQNFQRKAYTDPFLKHSNFHHSQFIPEFHTINNKKVSNLVCQSKLLCRTEFSSDEQILKILQTLQVDPSDLSFIQNSDFKEFLYSKIRKNWKSEIKPLDLQNLSSEQIEPEIQTEISFAREIHMMKNDIKKMVNDFYSKNKIKIKSSSQSIPHQHLNDFVSGFKHILNITPEFLNLIRKMIFFNPYKRLSMSELSHGIFSCFIKKYVFIIFNNYFEFI